jgi:hypothetical protein
MKPQTIARVFGVLYLITFITSIPAAFIFYAPQLPFRRWIALLGMVAAAGVLVGIFEPMGFEPAADIVVVGYILWSIWLALFGIFLLLPRSIGRRALRVRPAGRAITRIESLAGSDSDQ